LWGTAHQILCAPKKNRREEKIGSIRKKDHRGNGKKGNTEPTSTGGAESFIDWEEKGRHHSYLGM